VRTLAILCALTAAGQASAFQCTLTEQGASIGWSERSLVIRPSAQDGGEVTAAQLADAVAHGVAQWNGPACSDLTLSMGEPTAEQRAGFDYRAGKGSTANQNVVVFRNADPADPVDAWIHRDTNLAITTVTFLRSTAELLDADIEINDAGFVFSVCEGAGCQVRHDLKNTLTHELGHVIGLDHPPGVADATMFASSSEGDLSKRDLASDDSDGLCALYPAGAPLGDCGNVPPSPSPQVRVTQVGGCTSAGGTNGGAGVVVGMLAALLCAGGCRRGRSSHLWRGGARSAR
jgi:hypothetical protein